MGGRVEARSNGFHAKKEGTAEGCHVVVAGENETCAPCKTLEHDQRLKGMLAIAADPKGNLSNTRNDTDISFTHLKGRKDKAKKDKGTVQLALFNAGRKVSSKEAALGMSDRLRVLLTEQSVPGLQACLVQARKRDIGPKQLLAMVSRITQGLYKPTGQYGKTDIDMATLILRIAGPSGLFAVRQMLHLPSTSYLHKFSCLAHFHPVIFKSGQDYEDALRDAAIANIRTFFIARLKSGDLQWEGAYEWGWTLIMDEVAVDECVRWSAHGNCLLGACCQHGPRSAGTVYHSQPVAERMFDGLRTGRLTSQVEGAIHMAKECNVICVMPMGGQRTVGNDKMPVSRLIPVAAVGTCKKESVEHNVEMIEAIETAWELAQQEMKKVGKDLGPMRRLGTDGDGKRRQAATRLCNDTPLIELGEEQQKGLLELQHLPLFDVYGGKYAFTVDFDWRHMIKRIRFRLIFTKGGMRLSPKALPLARATVQVKRREAQTPTYAHPFVYNVISFFPFLSCLVVVVVVDSFFREFDATKLDHTKKLTPPSKGGRLLMHARYSVGSAEW